MMQRTNGDFSHVRYARYVRLHHVRNVLTIFQIIRSNTLLTVVLKRCKVFWVALYYVRHLREVRSLRNLNFVSIEDTGAP